MLATIHIDRAYTVDFSKPLDISIPLTNSDSNPIAWYLDQPEIKPVDADNWIGKVSEGASTNFNNISFNPHGHGTHTECVGHITKDFYSVNQSLKTFFFIAELVTIEPQRIGDDLAITKNQLEKVFASNNAESLIIRTTPNTNEKLSKKYSNTNPPYLDVEAARYIRESGIRHLLIDLPSVDREHDAGKLAAHKEFWNVTNVEYLNENVRHDATITEMIFVPNSIEDGTYLLNLQIAPFENDASPSKPILYQLL